MQAIRLLRSGVLAVIVALSPAARAQDETYIALGDSLAFGITDTPSYIAPSNGDRGYVAPYADWLASGSGGIRPHVVNLAIFGETTGSFFDTTNSFRQYNTNYPAGGPSQSVRFAQAVADEAAAGRTISRVTIHVGANDLIQLVTPEFLLLPPSQQIAQVVGILSQAESNFVNVLGQVRTALPSAELVTVGFFNPFAAVPGHPLEMIATPAILGLNDVVAGVSAVYGARYVDVYGAFLGREAELTYMLSEDPIGMNAHANAAGYAVMAAQIIPAPGVIVLLLGAAGLSAAKRRRSAA
ncbi:MAG: hypothetical protein H7Y88_02690 [Phycisphaerales bacterium]|nr:hypothetical protein [Phycisphaerales bacterium]